jgi:zinc protease
VSDTAVRTVLANGLTVITKEIHRVPIASFWVWYRVGSRNEKTGITGISHWVEHMMFQGTPSFGKGEIFRRISADGGVLNGFTWLDYTAYFETVPISRLDLPIEMEADRMANSLFLPEEVERERTVIISEREGSENSPVFLLGEELNAAAFAAHPYGHSVIGWKLDLQTMTRDDLYSHYRTYYTPNNAVVVAIGDFDTDKLLGRIRERFEPIPSGPQAPQVRTIEPPQRGERRVTVRYPAGAPYFNVGYHGPALSDPDFYPMLLLDAILSGGKPMGVFGSRGARMGRSSRLYRALVDSGLASGAGSSIAMTKDPYLFEIDATLNPGVSLETVEKVVFQEVERLQQEGVSQDEMQRALKQVKAQFVYGSETVTDQGYWLGAMETIDSYETYLQMLERIEVVSPEDVRNVAQKYLVETNRTVGWLIPTGEYGTGGPAALEEETVGVGQPCFYSQPDDEVLSSEFWVLGSGKTDSTPNTQNSAPRTQNYTSGIVLPIHREQLDNGIVVLTSHNPTSPQVIVRASFLAGSVFDTEEMAGLARFTAPMMMRGTEVRSFRQLSEETDGLGMGLSVDAGRLSAQAGIRCLKEDLPRGLELLAEVLRRPIFPEDEIEKLRVQFITSLRQQDTNPRSVAERHFLEEIYPEGHPYRLWPLGTQETVGRIGRRDLVDFYSRYYRPDLLNVSLVGDIAPAEAVEQISRVLGDWKAEGTPPEINIPQTELPRGKRVESTVPGKFQSEIVMGLPALSRRDPDYYAMRLGNLILGELGLSGRLGANIRDQQGLAYHVSSDLQASIGPSPWAIRAGVNPANVDQAIESAFREIEKWRSDLVSDDEIKDGKNFLTGSLPIGLETDDGVARVLLDIEFYQLGLDYLVRYPELIRSVTPEAIREAVQRWIHPEHIVTVVAGPERG